MAKTIWTETVSANNPIRGTALTELRTAIKNELGRRSLGTLVVTDASPSGATVKAVHITELTTQLSKIAAQGNMGAVRDAVMAASTITLLRTTINSFEEAPAQGGSGGCNAACTGLCQSCTGSCIGSCTSCTGCSGTCTGGCSGCSGTCTDACTGTCTGTCFAFCANDCANSCALGCILYGGG